MENKWRGSALCAQTDPEAFFPANKAYADEYNGYNNYNDALMTGDVEYGKARSKSVTRLILTSHTGSSSEGNAHCLWVGASWHCSPARSLVLRSAANNSIVYGCWMLRFL